MVIFTKTSISPKCQHSFVKVSNQNNKGTCVKIKCFHFIFLLFVIHHPKFILFILFYKMERVIMYVFFLLKKIKTQLNNKSNPLQNASTLPGIFLAFYLIFTTNLCHSTIMNHIVYIRNLMPDRGSIELGYDRVQRKKPSILALDNVQITMQKRKKKRLQVE